MFVWCCKSVLLLLRRLFSTWTFFCWCCLLHRDDDQQQLFFILDALSTFNGLCWLCITFDRANLILFEAHPSYSRFCSFAPFFRRWCLFFLSRSSKNFFSQENLYDIIKLQIVEAHQTNKMKNLVRWWWWWWCWGWKKNFPSF